MSLNAGWTELSRALKALRQHWEDVQASWDDPVSRDFEENRLLPLEGQVDAALRAMDRLGPLLARVKRDCSLSD